jgi:hypothetical protein
MMLVTAGPALAQTDPNPGAVTLTGSTDFSNAYFFRGFPQDDTGLITWPAADLAFALFSGDGRLKSVGVNVGTWNSLHTGLAGTDGPGKLWYESDFYATFGLGFGGGVNLGTTYTAYTSPNGLFGTVKEISFKLSVDDSGVLGAASVKPYALLAFELDGQADGGANEGKYLELGVAPGFAARRATVAVPMKVGLSLGDYYEGLRGDETFGFFSIAGVVTVPFTSMPTKFGTWNMHGAVEFLKLGDRNQAFGETYVVTSIGLGFSY